MSSAHSEELFRTPFSRRYWSMAAGEMKSVRMLVIAAVMTAARVGVKSLRIPVGPDLNITFGFVFNAVGSMIYGPVMAIAASAVSDTLGALLFPTGTYFFPFIFEEITGGVLFALFYYRCELTTARIILGRFAVTVIDNLILSPVLLYYYYALYLGKSYSILSLPRLIKNAVLFPIQCLILVVLLRILVPYTARIRLTYSKNSSLKWTAGDGILLAGLTGISLVCVGLYYFLK